MTRRRTIVLAQAALLLGVVAIGSFVALRSDRVDAPPVCLDECRAEVAATHAAAIDAFNSQTPEPSATPDPDATVTISAVGDIALGRQVVDRMEANGSAYPFELVRPLLDGDIVVGNLEGPLTTRGDPWPKSYNFRTPPSVVGGYLPIGGLLSTFTLLSLANNHGMDYGSVGLEDTLQTLYPGGGISVGAVGAGLDEHEAWSAQQILDTNGPPWSDWRVSFLACVLTPDEGSGFSIRQWQATASSPGVAVCDPDRIRTAVATARAGGADFVVLMVHAGDEYVHEPNATQRQIADAALDAGADVVLGSHAHVVQPVEQRGNQLIAWGLGNFVFDLDEVDLANIPEPRVSLVLDITLQRGRGVIAWEAKPVVLDVNEDRPRPAQTDAERAALERAIQP